MTKHPKVGDQVFIDARASNGAFWFPRRHRYRGMPATVVGWDGRDIDLIVVDRDGDVVSTRARLRFLRPVRMVALT